MTAARHILAGLVLGIQATLVGAQALCGPLSNAYGPYDYWTDFDKLVQVEQHHFTPEVETLRKGRSGSLGGDLDYTLRASPNHPRALVAMMKLAEKQQQPRPSDANYTIECYFDRAIRFRPKDGMVRLIYAGYLSKHGQNAEGLKQLEIAAESGLDTGNFHYNLGLAYFEAKEYEKSLRAAHRAYALGFNLPGLKAKLQKAGKWQDAPVVPPVARSAGGAGGAEAPAETQAPKSDPGVAKAPDK